MSFALYLASSSPRRRELLRQIGVAFEVLAVAVPEHRRDGEPPRDLAMRLARDKARAAAARVAREGLPRRPVLAADTCVVLDGEVLGKPRDRDQGEAMLAALSGRGHEVVTAVCLSAGQAQHTAVSVTRVHMAPLNRAAIRRYWESGEPRDKAGAYGIQGLAAAFVTHIEGSYSGVVGLPLFEVARLLNTIGVEIP